MLQATESYTTVADDELVRRVQTGEMDAFAEIYNRHYVMIHRMILRKTSFDRELSEDIAAETFAKAHRSIHTFTGARSGGVSGWLTTIARNLLNDHRKSSSTRKSVLLDEIQWSYVHTYARCSVPAFAAEDIAITSMTQAADATRVEQALKQLSERERTCITHRFFDEYSVLETATNMSMSESAVKALQYRALRKLSRLMAQCP